MRDDKTTQWQPDLCTSQASKSTQIETAGLGTKMARPVSYDKLICSKIVRFGIGKLENCNRNTSGVMSAKAGVEFQQENRTDWAGP